MLVEERVLAGEEIADDDSARPAREGEHPAVGREGAGIGLGAAGDELRGRELHRTSGPHPEVRGDRQRRCRKSEHPRETGRAAAFGGGRGPRSFSVDLDRRQEPEPPAVQGLDIARLPGVVLERPAQDLDRLAEGMLRDGDPVPGGVEKGLFGDDLPRVRQEVFQNLGGAGRKRDVLSVAREEGALGVEKRTDRTGAFSPSRGWRRRTSPRTASPWHPLGRKLQDSFMETSRLANGISSTLWAEVEERS